MIEFRWAETIDEETLISYYFTRASKGYPVEIFKGVASQRILPDQMIEKIKEEGHKKVSFLVSTKQIMGMSKGEVVATPALSATSTRNLEEATKLGRQKHLNAQQAKLDAYNNETESETAESTV